VQCFIYTDAQETYGIEYTIKKNRVGIDRMIQPKYNILNYIFLEDLNTMKLVYIVFITFITIRLFPSKII
jgi:hypothetical protein